MFLSMLELKLVHVNESGPGRHLEQIFQEVATFRGKCLIHGTKRRKGIQLQSVNISVDGVIRLFWNGSLLW